MPFALENPNLQFVSDKVRAIQMEASGQPCQQMTTPAYRHQNNQQTEQAKELKQPHIQTQQHAAEMAQIQAPFAFEVSSQLEMPQRKHLFPPVYPCHYILQRAGYMGVWLGMHIAILSYFMAKHGASDWAEGLNLASQYGILASVMGILLAMSPTFLGLLRSTPLNRIMTFEKRVHAHKYMSYILFVWTAAHSSLHYWTGVTYATSSHLTRLFVFWQDPLGITGQLMWMLFLSMGLAALPPVRRACYEAFYYVHHLYIVNIVLLYVHSQNGKAIRYVTGPLAIFGLDYVYRCIRSYPLIWSRRARIRFIKFHPGDIVEIGFDRRELAQHTKIGQYVKICVPELGIFQWHPFTLTATPTETKIMADGKPHGIWRIHFKVAGNWTYRLSQRLQKVAAGGDAYTNNFDQEARIGRVINDMIVPEVVPLPCTMDEHENGYIMAIASRLDSVASVDSAVEVHSPDKEKANDDGAGTRTNAKPEVTAGNAGAGADEQLVMTCYTGDGNPTAGEIASPMASDRTCREVLAPKKPEFDGRSFLTSSNTGSERDSIYDDAGWFDAETGIGRGGAGYMQATLPTILVDGPYNAPMETFFEHHANMIFAAGIGITPYIAALERVLDLCNNRIPARTTQQTREDLLPQRIYLVWVFRDISLLCVLLPVLQRLRANARAQETVVPCLYVTGPLDVEHEGAVSDVFGRPMARLSNGIRLSQGRPPIARMVSYMAGKHPNSRVGVFCCAPRQMTSVVRSSVHNTNAAVAHQGTHLEMRSECFSM
ncbi:hypothetical protein BX070DRAFT_250921 [Coemansia spiralis]|nr:hypothetical protein BX070DRAFT_250921 [Coemansia spiralis]